MEPTDPFAAARLPTVVVDTDAALGRTRARGRRRQRRRGAAFVAGAVGVVLLVVIAIAAATGDGDPEGVVADGGGDRSTTTGPTSGLPAPPQGDLALWAIDPEAPPDPDATTFVALVTRVGCNGGVTGEVRGPSVEVRPDDIVVTFAVAPSPGVHECPGNPAVSMTVDVGEPIGDRYLRDGACATADPRRGSDCVQDDGSSLGIRSDVRWPEGAVIEPHACDAPEGSPIDVVHEPDTRQYADWSDVTDGDQCLVRIDVVSERSGAEHCGFGSVRVLIAGDPFGTRHGTAEESVYYVRDPDGAFGDPDLAAGFVAGADLPEGAVPSGYFIDGQNSVWIDPDDPSAVWVFTADTTIERWPRGEQQICR